MSANLVFEVAVLLNLDELLLFLFLGAGADSSGYSMLVRIPSVKAVYLVHALSPRVVHWPFRPPRARRKLTRGLLARASVTEVLQDGKERWSNI